MHIFYTTDSIDNIYTLPEEESKHCIKVLRLSIGNKIQLINGKGKSYIAEIVKDHYKNCMVQIIEVFEKQNRRDHILKIAIAPTKNISRFETFLEKATEIGIDEINPFISRFSERKVIKNERLEKVIISAVKQSKTLFKPKLSELSSFNEIINTKIKGEKYIAHCYDSNTKKHLKEVYTKTKDVLILIGPEGDFSVEEIKQAVSKGFTEVSLSESRLRTETAGIIACQIIDFINT